MRREETSMRGVREEIKMGKSGDEGKKGERRGNA